MKPKYEFNDVIGVIKGENPNKYIPTQEELEQAKKIAKAEFEKIHKAEEKWKEEHPGEEMPKSTRLTRLIVVDENGKVLSDSIND